MTENNISSEIIVNAKARDEALDFLEKHRDERSVALAHNHTYTYKLRRKADLYVIPFLTFVYALNFIDKVLLNVRPVSEIPQPRLTYCLVFECNGPVAEPRAERKRFHQCIISILDSKCSHRSFQQYASVPTMKPENLLTI
jgi:hypothetical protein